MRGGPSSRAMRLLGVLLLPLLAPSARAGAVITRQQIAQAVRIAGLSPSPTDVELLSAVPARQANPALKLLSLRSWEEGKLKARLSCVDRSACLPFYVLIRAETPLAGANPAPSLGQGTSAPATKTRYDVRRGDPAILVFETQNSRVTVRVTCAQNGRRGETIQVASQDRKRFYRAEVVQPGLLKGTL